MIISFGIKCYFYKSLYNFPTENLNFTSLRAVYERIFFRQSTVCLFCKIFYFSKVWYLRNLKILHGKNMILDSRQMTSLQSCFSCNIKDIVFTYDFEMFNNKNLPKNKIFPYRKFKFIEYSVLYVYFAWNFVR